MNMQWKAAAILGLLSYAPAHAGNSTGTIGQVMVGRLGNQVFIEVQAAQYTGWPCATTHPSGFRYAFLLGTEKAKAMLSTILTAQASGQHLQVIGTGACTIDASLEDVDYVVLRP